MPPFTSGYADGYRSEVSRHSPAHAKATLDRERDALMRHAKNLLVAYMPYKVQAHNIVTDLLQARVRGHWRHPFMRDLWRYVGVDGYAR